MLHFSLKIDNTTSPNASSPAFHKGLCTPSGNLISFSIYLFGTLANFYAMENRNQLSERQV